MGDYIPVNLPASVEGKTISGRFYVNSSTGSSKSVAVIAHPYGRLGGTQDDHVVVATANLFRACEISALTFNFRSPSTFRGLVERDDYLAAVEHILKQARQADTIYLCGYSYGSLCLPTPEEIKNIVEIELKVHYIVLSPLLSPVSTLLTLSGKDRYEHVRNGSHLAIWGEKDTFTSSRRLKAAWPRGIAIPDADHFWRSEQSMRRLRDSILAFLEYTKE